MLLFNGIISSILLCLVVVYLIYCVPKNTLNIRNEKEASKKLPLLYSTFVSLSSIFARISIQNRLTSQGMQHANQLKIQLKYMQIIALCCHLGSELPERSIILRVCLLRFFVWDAAAGGSAIINRLLHTNSVRKLLASAALVVSAAFPLAAEAQYGYSSGSYFGWGRAPSTQTYQRNNGYSSGSYFGSPRPSTPSYGSSYGSGMNYRGLGVRDCSKYIRC